MTWFFEKLNVQHYIFYSLIPNENRNIGDNINNTYPIIHQYKSKNCIDENIEPIRLSCIDIENVGSHFVILQNIIQKPKTSSGYCKKCKMDIKTTFDQHKCNAKRILFQKKKLNGENILGNTSLKINTNEKFLYFDIETFTDKSIYSSVCGLLVVNIKVAIIMILLNIFLGKIVSMNLWIILKLLKIQHL